MYKLIKIPLVILFAILVLIVSFYLSTFVQTWWDSLDPGAQYYQAVIPDDMKRQLLRAISYHGSGHVYRSDWGKWEFTFKRNGKVINTFGYLEKENGSKI